MTKIILKSLLICCVILATSFSAYGQKNSKTSDNGVVINGVKWATRNVGAPGTFATSPESAGKFYQWNRRVAYPATSKVSNWDNSIPDGTEWTAANDPSPDGWRVPTLDEIKSLLDTKKVTNESTTQNGVNGRKFTDKSSGNSIFLPAVGSRYHNVRSLFGVGGTGFYWSSSSYSDGAYILYFRRDRHAESGSDVRRNGLSIRCVAK
jgi:uncharacterized protein (TIGR02145 family)